MTSKAEARVRELEAQIAAIKARWDECLPAIQSAESIAFIHGWRYRGPAGGMAVVLDDLPAAAKKLLENQRTPGAVQACEMCGYRWGEVFDQEFCGATVHCPIRAAQAKGAE